MNENGSLLSSLFAPHLSSSPMELEIVETLSVCLGAETKVFGKEALIGDLCKLLVEAGSGDECVVRIALLEKGRRNAGNCVRRLIFDVSRRGIGSQDFVGG